MYSKKVLLEALAEAPGDRATWAFFPVELAQGGALRVWVVPEKLKLLRLLGLEYAVHKKKKAPDLIHAGVRGLIVEQAPAGEGASPCAGGSTPPPGPQRTDGAGQPYVMVGETVCRLGLSREFSADVDLQQWIDTLLRIRCPTPVSADFPVHLRELCDACCRGRWLGDTSVSTNAGSHMVQCQCTLEGLRLKEAPPERATPTGARSPPAEAVRKDFSLRLHFAQVEPDYVLALAHLELKGQVGGGRTAKYLHEFAGEAPLLAFLEDRLRDFLHDWRPKLLSGEDSLAEVEKLLTESGKEAAQGCSVADVVAGAAFLDLARERKRAAERWRNIRS